MDQDGQGIPDCFAGHGRPNPETDGTMLVLGVGVCTGKIVDEWAGTRLLSTLHNAALP